MCTMTWRICLIVGVLFIIGSVALAQETYDLRSQYHVGQVIVVTDTQNIAVDVPEPGIAGAAGLPAGKYHHTVTSVVRARVMEVADALPTVKRAVVTKGEVSNDAPGEPGGTVTSPLLGKVIVVTSAPGKPLSYALQNGDPVDSDEANNWFGDMGGALARALNPRMGALKIGDEVVATPEDATVFFQEAGVKDATFKAKLVEVTGPADEQVARLDFVATANVPMGTDVNMAASLTGKCLFSLARKHPDSFEGEGKMRVAAVDKDGKETGPVGEGTLVGKTVYADAPEK